MQRLALFGAGLALLTASPAMAQLGQFQTVYNDEGPALKARYTVSLGARPASQVSLTFTQNAWDSRQPTVTLVSYDRQGLAPLGLTSRDWQRLALDEDETTDRSGNAGVIIIGGLAIVAVGAVVFAREFEDGVEDTLDCLIASNCPP